MAAAAAEAIYICIDDSLYMRYEKFIFQWKAIELYCKAKLKANQDTVVGLITMGKNYSKSSIVLWPPSSHIVDIMDALKDVSAVARHANVSCMSTFPISLMHGLDPQLKKRILLFVGGPTDLSPPTVASVSKFYIDSSVALDVVNFYLEEERCNFSAYRFGRSALDALVDAINVHGDCHIVHVRPESSIEDAVNDLLDEDCKEKHHNAAAVDGIEYARHDVTLSNKFERPPVGDTLAH